MRCGVELVALVAGASCGAPMPRWAGSTPPDTEALILAATTRQHPASWRRSRLA
jgi:hypothetical protein